MTPAPKALAASFVVVALVELFWVSLFLVGYGSIDSGGMYLVAHSVTATLLLWAAVLVWRGSPRWAIPVALGALGYLMVVSPVVLKWVVTGDLGLFWRYATTTAVHDGISFWLKFDIVMFQCVIPTYFFCILVFVAWRTVLPLGNYLRRGAHEG